jgi:hypothetical protein
MVALKTSLQGESRVSPHAPLPRGVSGGPWFYPAFTSLQGRRAGGSGLRAGFVDSDEDKGNAFPILKANYTVLSLVLSRAKMSGRETKAEERNRTADLLITSEPLYRLSYFGPLMEGFSNL